jgi:hypothetical protein
MQESPASAFRQQRLPVERDLKHPVDVDAPEDNARIRAC